LRRRRSAGGVALSREGAMALHKFTAGQSVRFSPHRYEDNSARGLYTIVRLLPEEGSTPQYRIKAKVDGRERVVREDQLARP
jgi:hypothetical protein